MDIKPHLKLNGYEFQREIGRGQFAVVWEALHLFSNNQVAIKCISNNLENEEKENIAIIKEIYFNYKIFHPFICQYFDFFEVNSIYFLVFEKCSENLVTFSNKRGFLDEKTAHKIFCELLYAVESLHNDYNIIHRDLKVENILIDSNKNIRISDFGLSVSIEPKTSHCLQSKSGNLHLLNQQVGSIYYMSPEMAKKEEYDKSIDIWSLGVILYAITNGKLPFDGESVDSVKQKILFTQPQFQSHFSSYSPNLKTLIVRMLDKNKKSRITIDEIKKNPWFTERKYKKIDDFLKNSFDLTQNQIDKAIVDKIFHGNSNDASSKLQSIQNEMRYFQQLKRKNFQYNEHLSQSNENNNNNNKNGENSNNNENQNNKKSSDNNNVNQNINRNNDGKNNKSGSSNKNNDNENHNKNENENKNENHYSNENSNNIIGSNNNENINVSNSNNDNDNSNENSNNSKGGNNNENTNVSSSNSDNHNSNENSNNSKGGNNNENINASSSNSDNHNGNENSNNIKGSNNNENINASSSNSDNHYSNENSNNIKGSNNNENTNVSSSNSDNHNSNENSNNSKGSNNNENNNASCSNSDNNNGNSGKNESNSNVEFENSRKLDYEKYGIKQRSADFVSYLIQMRESLKSQMKIEERDIISCKPSIITSPRQGKRQMSQPPKSAASLSQSMKPSVKKPIIPAKKQVQACKTKKQPLSLSMKAADAKKKKA